jgi:hypothetical protein
VTIDSPQLPEVDTDIRYTLFGSEVNKDHFGRFSSRDGPVYIDGSAFRVRTPFATSGWAAVQMVDGRISRSMMAPAHRNFPQTSDFAEHIAFYFVSLHSSVEDPFEVVTDCASVISYYNQSLGGTATSYNNVLGGIWGQVKTETVAQTHKIKSHMSYDRACAAGVGHLWAGTSQADSLAQRAAERALVASGEANSDKKLVAKAEKFLRDLAQSFVMWKGTACRHHELEKVAAERTPSARVLPPHSYEWDPVDKVWACATC